MDIVIILVALIVLLGIVRSMKQAAQCCWTLDPQTPVLPKD